MDGADGIRTHDPLVANQVLSQLSYRPPGLQTSREWGNRGETSSRRRAAETPGGGEEPETKWLHWAARRFDGYYRGGIVCTTLPARSTTSIGMRRMSFPRFSFVPGAAGATAAAATGTV
jgi:hypothetical protein